jgi:hypothetical protein
MSVQNGQFTRTNSFGPGQDAIFPRFYLDQVEDQVASANSGRPIFRDEERVEIIMPGNPHTRPVHRVSDEHRQRWPKQYEAFKKGIELSPDGTPLEEWPRLKRSQVLELKGLGFQTVEQVASMDDHAVQRIGIGGRQIRELARAFIDDAERCRLTEQLSAEAERKDMRIATLENQVREMGDKLNEVFSRSQAAADAPNAIESYIPGAHDPMEQAKRSPVSSGVSSLGDIAGPRRRGPGRPSNASKAAEGVG